MLPLLIFIVAQAPIGAPPVEASREAEIRKHCLIEWPDDFRMQEYCHGRSLEGLREFVRSYREFGPVIEKAMERCVIEWTKEGLPDWSMIGHCSKQQADALRRRGG